jgi:alpha-1,3-rhamnosyl/mannosyltransferase
VFAFPSLYEGFGFPVLEAMAAGTVVVTSDRGSLAEVAGPAIRFESLEIDAIAHGIATAVADESARKKALAEGADWVAKFTWDASVEKHIEVYKKVLG